MSTENNEIRFYVRGNVLFPSGVLTRLVMIGGTADTPFSQGDLSNPHHIFYIDFHNNNQITMIDVDSVIGNLLTESWQELEPITYIDHPESLPTSWEDAVDRCNEAHIYDAGKSTKLLNKLLLLGRLITLRDIYRQDWIPKEDSEYYHIVSYNGELEVIRGYNYTSTFSFQTIELAEMFLNNFDKLLKEVDDLI